MQGFTTKVGRYSLALFMLAMTAAPAQAASVSYFLDQSNKLPDGVNYLSVRLDEIAGGVNVFVETLDPLNSIAGHHFGIQKFAFSLADETSYEISGLPDYWKVTTNKRMDGFGKFDVRLQGKGKARTDDLSFTVTGAGLGDFNPFFAAHVAGFEWCKLYDEDRGGKYGKYRWCGGKDCVTSAYFAGGSSGETTAVPLPAAMWLFGSSLLGLIGVARRGIESGVFSSL